ncbi:MAG: cobamide remodeling phosphodiesterase CbiR [Chloroflexota bacterium]
MRYGIMAMQLGLILPGEEDLDRGTVLGRLAKFDIAQLVTRLADAGFNLIELNTDLELFLPGCLDAAAVARLAALRAERGLAYTVHLPLWSMEPATPDPRVRVASVATLADALTRLEPLQPEVYVLHSTGALAAEFSHARLPALAKGLILERFHEMARQSLGELLQRTAVAPRRLALENVEFPLEFTLRLAEEFDCSLCLDTGHVLAGYSGPSDLERAVSLFLPRLGEVHLHDGFRRAEGAGDHLPLGQGDLPVAWLLSRLADGGYAGPVILELAVPDAIASLAALQSMQP